MRDSKKIKAGSFHWEHYVWGVPLLWTLVIVTSLVWNVIHMKQMILEEARIQARVAFEKDIIYRHWNTKHGGVYVPVTKETQPNPYLSHLPERDITTPSGKLLTLINPAYMTRQVHELAKEKYGILGHITSLNPIRSENAPDPWEINALQVFERGETEINSVEKMEGKDYMRLMLPLITEKACLKCHAAQGYREGDIRGGISVSIPMEPLWAIERNSIQMLALVHILIWLVGLGGIGLAAIWLRKSEQERKRAEEQLQKAYAQLEQRVEERTAELRTINESLQNEIAERKRAEEEKAALKEQFRQSQKMEAIGRLAGGIAHDFNNLLTVIKGYSELSLIKLKEGDPLKGNIEEIHRASQRAANLTRQLLAFSRRQILEMKVLDLNTILKDLDKMLRRVIGEDIELVTLFAEGIGRIRADPGQIEQMILNLTVNARDAMPNGGKLTIETSNIELDENYVRSHIAVKPGLYVMLSVSDTGVGMTPEVKERVFEPFFTTKEKGKGTGLGLSTVYGIVKQSGGNIWVYSEPGHGTTFKIYLPWVEEKADALHRRDDPDILPRGSETVLLVEDDLSVRGLAVRVLRENGYNLLEAANGNEALRMAQEYAGEIHLLLTDVVMPQMGGKELADRIKPLRPDIKVLFTSGYTDNAIVHHGVLEPGTNFLQKPFSPASLAHKVREVLDK
jgi:signal transduction histidine kinase/CheY-like chemotaxis protein